jgi:protein NRD1
VSSLYVFEALARAAKHSANKHSLPIKEISSDKPGNAGTFLFKLEGILDGLVEDMIALDTPEATVRYLVLMSSSN